MDKQKNRIKTDLNIDRVTNTTIEYKQIELQTEGQIERQNIDRSKYRQMDKQ